jgi:hypothetical protein
MALESAEGNIIDRSSTRHDHVPLRGSVRRNDGWAAAELAPQSP